VGQGGMMMVIHGRTAMQKALAKALQPETEHGEALELMDKVEQLQDKNYKLFLISNAVGIISSMAMAAAIYFEQDSVIQLYAPPQGMSKELIDLAKKLLLINIASLPFDASRNVTAGILRGWKDLLYPTIVSLILMTALAIPVGFAVGFEMEETLLPFFIARAVAILVADVVSIYRFYQRKAEDVMLYNNALATIRSHEVPEFDAEAVDFRADNAVNRTAVATASGRGLSFASVLIDPASDSPQQIATNPAIN
jgi:hypothetical protein